MGRRSWERTSGTRHHYAQVNAKDVVVGYQGNSPHVGGAGSCSHEAFLDGQMHDLVREAFGEAVLEEMLQAVRDAGPMRAEALAEIARYQRYLDGFPNDPSLASLLNDPGAVSSDEETKLQPDGSYLIRSDTLSLRLRPGLVPARLERNTDAERFNPLDLFGLGTGVERRDHFFLGGDGYAVIYPSGKVVTDGADSMFGSTLRLGKVWRCRDAILFRYDWFDYRDGDPGLLRYELDQGFVARCETPQP